MTYELHIDLRGWEVVAGIHRKRLRELFERFGFYHPEYECSICRNQTRIINHRKFTCDFLPNPAKGCPLFKKEKEAEK